MRDHPGRIVEAEGGGTAKGLEALIRGRVEIAAASRPLEAEEARRMVEAHGTLGYAVLVARDALSVYLHPDNPVRVLTLDETRRIFTGEIEDWEGVGGTEAPIRVLNRNPASGTRHFFAQHVLLGDRYSRRAEVLPTTEAIVERVRRDPRAVGYGGIGYAEGIRTAAVDGVLPTPESVREGRYPIARYLFLYTALPPRGLVKELVDWVLGPRGQGVVEEVGYLPLHSGAEIAEPPGAVE